MGRTNTAILYVGAAWETARFFFLFQILSFIVNPRANPLISLFILWLAAGQLCIGLLFFLGGYMPEKFACLKKITAVFKFLGILPPLVFVIIEGFLARFIPSAMRIPFGILIPLIIIGIDAFFLLYLALFSPEAEESSRVCPETGTTVYREEP
jgi:hypothetical protein